MKRRCVSIIGVKFWNDANLNLETCHSLLVFLKKGFVKQFLKLISSLNYVCCCFVALLLFWKLVTLKKVTIQDRPLQAICFCLCLSVILQHMVLGFCKLCEMSKLCTIFGVVLAEQMKKKEKPEADVGVDLHYPNKQHLLQSHPKSVLVFG